MRTVHPRASRPTSSGKSLSALLVATALLLGVPMASAAPTAIEVPTLAGLDEALLQRIEQIESLPSATPGEEQEQKALHGAVTQLGNYAGFLESYVALNLENELNPARQDTKTLVRVAALIVLSQTVDEGVLFQVGAIRDEIDDFGLEARQVALGITSVIIVQETKEAIEALVAEGDEARDQALGFWGVNVNDPSYDYGKGAVGLGWAWQMQHNAAEFASEQQTAEAIEFPVDLQPVGLAATGSFADGVAKVHAGFPFSMVATINAADVTTGGGAAQAPEVTLAVRAISQSWPAFPYDNPDKKVQLTLAHETVFDVEGQINVDIETAFPTFRNEDFVTKKSGFEINNFGGGVAIHGDNAAVVLEERLSILNRNEGGPNNWGEVKSYDAPPDGWGGPVAMWEQTIVVGAPSAGDEEPWGFGRAYVFQGNAFGEWGDSYQTLKMDVEEPGPEGTFPGFGRSVGVSEGWIVVGAPGFDSRGRAFVFTGNSPPGAVFVQTAQLEMDPRLEAHRFGTSVAIDDGTIVVGSPEDASGPYDLGYVHIFEFTSAWTLTQLLGGEDTGSWGADPLGHPVELENAQFGSHVAIDTRPHANGQIIQTIAVGAPSYDYNLVENAGRAFLFSRLAPKKGEKGNPFLEKGVDIEAPSPVPGSGFGADLALSGQLLIVGASREDKYLSEGSICDPASPEGYGQGAAYVFVAQHHPGCSISSEGGWGLIARRTIDGQDDGSGDGSTSFAFGSRVAAYGNTLLATYQSGHELLPGFCLTLPDSHNLRIFTGMEPIVTDRYDLVLQVDPHDKVEEWSHTEGEEAINNIFFGNNILLCVPPLDHYNLSLDTVEFVGVDSEIFGSDVIFQETLADPDVDPPEASTQLTPAGLNVTVSMTGSIQVPLLGASISAKAVIDTPGTKTTIDGVFWNPLTQAHDATQAQLPNMSVGDTVSAHLDVRFEDAVLAAGNYSWTIETTLHTPGAETVPQGVPDPELDNRMNVSLDDYTVLFFPICSFSELYEKRMGNQFLEADVNFATSLDLSGNFNSIEGAPASLYSEATGEAGAIGSASGDIDVTLMGFPMNDLVGFRMLAELDPTDSTYWFVGTDLKFTSPIGGGSVIIYSVGPYDSESIPPGFDPILPDGIELELEGNGFTMTIGLFDGGGDESFQKEVCVEKEQTFFPGGFPVTVKGKAQGSIGADLIIGANTLLNPGALRASVEPFAELKVLASAAVGACDVLCVGAEGEIVLVNDTFRVTAGVGMVTKESEDPENDWELIKAGFCFEVANKIKMLEGKLSAFAKYPWIDLCVGFIPCSEPYIKKSSFTIISWQPHILCQAIYSAADDLNCCVEVEGPGLGKPPGVTKADFCTSTVAGQICSDSDCD